MIRMNVQSKLVLLKETIQLPMDSTDENRTKETILQFFPTHLISSLLQDGKNINMPTYIHTYIHTYMYTYIYKLYIQYNVIR